MDYIEIEKPVLYEGVLSSDIGDIKYTRKFLQKIAEESNPKLINLELNKHGSDPIGEVTDLRYDDGKLLAKMKIPSEYVKDGEVGFSTHFVPSSIKAEDEYFVLEDAQLKGIVYINDDTRPRDLKTLTNIMNTEDTNKGDSVNEEMIRKTALLEKENENLLKELENLKKELETVNNKYSETESLLESLRKEAEAKESELKKYIEMENMKKQELINKLVVSPEDPKRNIYEKLSFDELELLIKESNIATPPKGTGDKVVVEEPAPEVNDPLAAYKDDNGVLNFSKFAEDHNL